ncbi:hypothetical protein EXIGLDRAFT_360142 [Exidia glandulosa HHB12029]|uniref:Uncharacterized protein n=1 Tax=Exidia glandulosa HHB12029 TaxID=1314781 RepID=A0A165C6L2_EXIGL|nr:hypothetical protein EXIGLDRAFT_360142 [Exidia glandulosa HHB12029]
MLTCYMRSSRNTHVDLARPLLFMGVRRDSGVGRGALYRTSERIRSARRHRSLRALSRDMCHSLVRAADEPYAPVHDHSIFLPALRALGRCYLHFHARGRVFNCWQYLRCCLFLLLWFSLCVRPWPSTYTVVAITRLFPSAAPYARLRLPTPDVHWVCTRSYRVYEGRRWFLPVLNLTTSSLGAPAVRFRWRVPARDRSRR